MWETAVLVPLIFAVISKKQLRRKGFISAPGPSQSSQWRERIAETPYIWKDREADSCICWYFCFSFSLALTPAPGAVLGVGIYLSLLIPNPVTLTVKMSCKDRNF